MPASLTKKKTETPAQMKGGMQPKPSAGPVLCQTTITGLDEILGGGFPRGSVVLLSGASGTGKTSLALHWLFGGARSGENGIYASFTEPLFKVLKNLETLEYYDRKVIEEEKIRILDIRRKEFIEDMDSGKVLSYIEDIVRKSGAKRLVIDSVTAIAYSLEEKTKIRSFIFELGTMLASLGCTTILTSEVHGERYSMYGVEEFISDGVILLKSSHKGFGPAARTIQVVKMRGIDFDQAPTYFRISKHGVFVFPRIKITLDYPALSEKVSTGVRGFDEMTNGGVYRGSILLVAGSTGSGKSVTGMQFISDGLDKGEPCLYIGLEESRDQIKRNASKFGWDFSGHEESGLLKFLCEYPGTKYPEEHLMAVMEILDRNKIKRCVVDSLSAISNAYGVPEFRMFLLRLYGILKSREVTTIFTTATGDFVQTEKLTDAHISTITDAIIFLKYVEINSEMRLMASVIKTRGNDHSRSLREYRITSTGITVGESFKGYESVLSGNAKKVNPTLVEKLRAEFVRALGPIGELELSELMGEEQSADEERVAEYVESLITQGILDGQRGPELKRRIRELYYSDKTSAR